MKKLLVVLGVILLVGCESITLKDKNISTQSSEEVNLVDAGAIWERCASCHGKNGEVGALGVSEPIGGDDWEVTLEKLQAYKRGALNQYGFGELMKSQVANFSDLELEALAKYIQNL